MALVLGLDTFLGVLVVLVLSLAAFRLRALDASGALSAVAIGLAIFLGPSMGRPGEGWKWLGLLMLFFVLASASTRFRFDRKADLGAAEPKGGRRGIRNTVANGTVAAVAAIFEGVIQENVLAAAFVGALAAATADTMATEVGLLSRVEPRLITRLRVKVRPGTSGGVTLMGTLAGITGGFLISGVAGAMRLAEVWPTKIALVGSFGGIVGMLFDSFLGAAAQRRFRCRVCGQTVEYRDHHGEKGDAVSGIPWLENNMVNFLSTLAGALSSVALMFVL